MAKIILADDDSNLLSMQETVLKMKFPEYELESFRDGNLLNRRLNETLENINLIITDNEMPGISGSGIIEKYARDGKFRKIPFILCYGGAEEIGKKAVENGAYNYILKPFGIREYANVIEKALKRKQ